MKLTAEVAKLLRKYLADKFPGNEAVLSVRIDRWMVINGYSNYPTICVSCRRSREEDVQLAIKQHYGEKNIKGKLVHKSFYVVTSTMHIPMDEYDQWAKTQMGKPISEVQDPPEGKPKNMVYLTDEQGRFTGHTTKQLFNKMEIAQ